MAVKNLEIVVLRGVRVLNDVRMVLERNGSNPAVREPEATSLSFARHLYPSDPRTEADAGTRWHTPGLTTGGKAIAHRAGRSGSSAGVLDSSRLARTARQAVPSGRSLVLGSVQALPALRQPTGSLGVMPRPTMRGSLIRCSQPSWVTKRIPPVQQPQARLQQYGNFTTY